MSPKSKVYSIFLVLILLMTSSMPAQVQRDEAGIVTSLKARSKGFTDAVIAANVLGVRAEMSDTMKNTLTPDTAKTIAGDLASKGGKLNAINEPELFLQDSGHVVAMVPLDMGRQNFHAQVVFERASKRAKVIGFSIYPYVNNLSDKFGPNMEAEKINTVPPPSYADTKLFKEEVFPIEHKIKLMDESSFDIYVTVPLTASESSPVPIVYLVSGIGANDENYTVMDSKIFRDISYALSTRGIAAVRIASSSFRTPQPFLLNEHSMHELYYQDFNEAKEVLDRDARFSSEDVNLLGHNLGATILTEIFDTTAVSKYIFLNPLPTDPKAYVKSRIDAIVPQVEEGTQVHKDMSQALELVENHPMTNLPEKPRLLNYPAAVWRDWYRADPVTYLQNSNKPAFLALVDSDQFLEASLIADWTKVFMSEQLGRNYKKYKSTDHFLISTDPQADDFGYVRKEIVEDIILFVQTGRVN